KPCADLKSNRSCKTLRQPNCSPGKTRLESDLSIANFASRYVRTQQYSVTALTDSSGAIKERYAYDAYGGLSIFDGSGTTRTSTTEGNRYTFTGREWEEELKLYHYRARMYDALAGRFLSRDPIGYRDGLSVYQFLDCAPCSLVDPSGYLCGEPWESLGFRGLIDKGDIGGMPWQRASLNNMNAHGFTNVFVDAKCNCMECCDGWYIEKVNVDVSIWILLDITAILADGGVWDYTGPNTLSVEGVYGHEQRHVSHMMDVASNLFENEMSRIGRDGNRTTNYGKGTSGGLACIRACKSLTTRIKTTWQTALGLIAGHAEYPRPRRDELMPPIGIMPGSPEGEYPNIGMPLPALPTE
ncbi:RHS repeat domain-containing protein, partial [Rhodopirellula sp. JC639]|uniref:RHS repeat domain-containing protein n=1 Tax=Stieleria mannarensis TaxID=2755585 RepID=UPI0016026A98